MKICAKCGKEFYRKYAKNCSPKCSNSRERSEETRKKISEKLKIYYSNEDNIKKHSLVVTALWKDPEYREKITEKNRQRQKENIWTEEGRERHRNLVGQSTRGKYKCNPESLMDLSKRTISKILSRIKLACFCCGWDSANCDIHHIVPKAKGGNDSHSNLTYICPNCHRLAHKGKIAVEDLKTLEEVLKDNWKKYYYG